MKHYAIVEDEQGFHWYIKYERFPLDTHGDGPFASREAAELSANSFLSANTRLSDDLNFLSINR